MSRKLAGLAIAGLVTAAAIKVVKDILEADKQDKEIIELNKVQQQPEDQKEPEA